MKYILTIFASLFTCLSVMGQATIEDAYNLSKEGKIKEALDLANTILHEDLEKKDSIAIILDYGYISFIQHDSNDYAKEKECLNKGLAIWEKCNLEKDNLYYILKRNLVKSYQNLGEYSEALNLQNEILNDRITLNKANSKEVAEAFRDMGLLYNDLNDFENADVYISEALRIYEELYDKHSDDYLNAISFIAQAYLNSSQYNIAINYYQLIAELTKESNGDNNPQYCSALINVSEAYRNSGQYKKALELSLVASEKLNYLVEKNNDDYLKSLRNLASCHLLCGNIQEAKDIAEKLCRIIEENKGKNNDDYLIAKNNLANIYFESGDYFKAIDSGEEVIKLCEMAFGKNNIIYAEDLSNLGRYYSGLGNYNKAIDLEKEALEIKKVIQGENNEDFALSLNNLAQYLSNSYRWKEALDYQIKCCSILEKIIDKMHPRYAMALKNLAHLYSLNSNLNKSTELYLESLSIIENGEGKESLNYASCLHDLACNYMKLKEYNKAIDLQLKATNLFKTKIGTNNEPYYIGLSNLGLIYERIGDMENAENYYLQYSNSITKFIKDALHLMTESERRHLLEKHKSVIDGVLELALNINNTRVNSEAYNLILLNKGILLDTEKETRRILYKNKKTRSSLDYIEKNTNLKNELYTKYGSDAVIDSVQNCIDKELKKLINSSSDFKNYFKVIDCSWKDIRDKLNKEDMAVEFFNFFPISLDPVQPYIYIAAIIKKDFDYPQIVKLCTSIDLINSNEKNQYDLIWKPIEKHIDGVSKIYFAPCDTLNSFSLETLGLEHRINSDNYTMCRLSTTRELLKKSENILPKNAVLFGGLKYNATKTMTNDQNKKTRSSVDDISAETKLEIDNIADIFKIVNIPCTKYEGTSGTENALKNLSGSDIDLLHLSTHGYFYPIQSFYKDDIQVPNFAKSGLNYGLNKWEDHSLSRVGLLFSGLNSDLSDDNKIIEDDGYLSGLEIENLEFPKLDLVVLSACETGLGDTFDRDGILGLQRAFKKAGAKTIMMSLWKVDNEATRLFMTEFYRHYLNGESKHQALKFAQDYLRNYKEEDYSSPKYWAAFVLLDALD